MNVLQWPLPAGGNGTVAKPYTSVSGTGGIQEAIDVLPSFGGKIVIPAGYYSITTPINPKGKCVILVGEGWQTAVVAGFGDAQWTTSSIVGSVLLVTGTNDAFQFSSTQSGFFVRDLAVLGPGSGVSVGVNFNCTSFSYGGADNVLVANFGTGWNFSNTVSNNFGYIAARGCTTGFLLQNTVTDAGIDRLEAQANTTAASLLQATGLRIAGGLIQSNTNGILIAPAATAVYELSFESLWFENNTNYSFKFDSTHAAITDVLIRGSKAGTAGDAIAFGTLSNSLDRFTFESNDFRSFDISVPSAQAQWLFCNTVFNTLNAGKTIYVYNNGVLASIA